MMYKSVILISFNLFICFSVMPQNKLVKLNISDSLIISDKDYIKINTEFYNLKEEPLVFIDANVLSYPATYARNYKKYDVTSGLCVYIEDSSHKELKILLPIGASLKNHPIINNCFDSQTDSIIESDSIFFCLKPDTIYKYTYCFGIFNNQLGKGNYYLYLFYYMGDRVRGEININELEKFCKENDASVYKGSLYSNKIRLIVK